MPARRKVHRRSVVRKSHRRRGGSLFGWLKKANRFLKKHRVISTIGRKISPLHPSIRKATGIASMFGYGRCRGGRLGAGFRLAGSGTRRAGGRLR